MNRSSSLGTSGSRTEVDRSADAHSHEIYNQIRRADVGIRAPVQRAFSATLRAIIGIRVELFWVALAAFAILQVAAQPFSPNSSLLAPAAKPPVQEIEPGIFQIGEVRLDKNKKSAAFAGQVNMSTGLVEYAVVGARGKLHESMLATKAEPYHIHLAMLLLGATNQSAKAQSGQPLKGHPINISVSWKNGEKVRRARLEDLICREQQGKTLERGHWLYNGSRVVDGAFLAQRDESIVAMIEDGDALINNPRPGRESDEIWFVNEKTVPSANTPVQITLEVLGQED